MGKQKTYPVDMFPYYGLIGQVCIDRILEQFPNAAVVRRMEGNKEDFLTDMDDGLYTISRAKALDMLEDAWDMSMNLYTSKCPIENFHFLQKEQPACGKWNCGNVNVKECAKKLGYSEDCFAIVYPINHLHRKPGMYIRSYSDKTTYEGEAVFIDKVIEVVDATFSRKNTYSLSYTLYIKHKPTNANYWHATLDIVAPSDSNKTIKQPQKGKPKWMFEGDNPILSQIWMNYLRQGFEVNKTSCEIIDSDIFINLKANRYKRFYGNLKTRLKASYIKV